MKRIYMDYAATTPVDPRILKIMKPYFSKKFGNSMSLYHLGREAKDALEESREKIASFMNADANDLIFTGSATESDNMALKGIAFANKEKGKHIIISCIEHHAVLDTAKWLQNQGFELTLLPVDKYGFVDLKKLEESIRKDTIIVSIMHANNEIGTIEPLEEIGKICRENGVYFHTDATQSFGKIPIDVKKMNIDLLTCNAHKMYGPKGVGALFIRNDIKIEPLLHGGGHEFGLRSSTVNTAGIVGFAAAVDIAKKEMDSDAKKIIKLRDMLIEKVLKIEKSHLNGHPKIRLPNNANFWFSYIEGESLILHLDIKGVAASTGSACSSESLEPSHVLIAIGLKHEEAHGSLRLTMGKYTTKEEIDYVAEVLPGIVESLRKISPFKRDCK
jgi:cysteine desulfurase